MYALYGKGERSLLEKEAQRIRQWKMMLQAFL